MFILQYTDIELLTSKTLCTSQIFAICSSFNNETSHYNFGHCTVEVGGGNCDERMLMSLVWPVPTFIIWDKLYVLRVVPS